jgi:hypothetical protein
MYSKDLYSSWFVRVIDAGQAFKGPAGKSPRAAWPGWLAVLALLYYSTEYCIIYSIYFLVMGFFFEIT